MNGRDILFDNDDPIPDDDYIGVDDDEEELGVDYLSMEDTPDDTDNEIPLGHHDERPEPQRNTKGRAKIKKMPPGMLRKFPDVASMLITKTNGRQVLLINPNHYR